MKNSKENRKRRAFPQLHKEHLQKATAIIILYGEKLNSFPLTLGTRQGCLLPLFFVNTVLKVLANAIKQGGKKRQKEKIRKEEIKPSQFADMILHRKSYRIYKRTLNQ